MDSAARLSRIARQLTLAVCITFAGLGHCARPVNYAAATAARSDV